MYRLFAISLVCHDVLRLQEEALVWPARHVAEVLPEIVKAGGTSYQERLCHVEVALQVLELSRTAAEPEVAAEVFPEMRTSLVEHIFVFGLKQLGRTVVGAVQAMGVEVVRGVGVFSTHVVPNAVSFALVGLGEAPEARQTDEQDENW